MESKSKRDSWLVVLFLVLATLAVYLPVFRFEFITYDDPQYVFENPKIKQGLSAKAIAWAFTTTHAGNWHPLTWLSHMVDWSLFGPNAGGHHLTNVFFHIASTLVLFFALKRMTGAIWRSGFVAALFALHPLHVESVAWVSERKDVLSAFFWMLTMLFYGRYAQARSRSEGAIGRGAVVDYALAVVFFAIGLLAKQMLVTLPFTLLLLDIWPLHRVRLFELRSFSKLVIEKLPFFVITAVFIPIAIWAQRTGHAVIGVDAVPLDQRIENSVVSYFRYFEKMMWPSKLAVFYPYPGIWPAGLFIVAAVFLIAGSALAVWRLKARPYLFVGWCWFLGTLIPVIGLMQIGAQSMADRYSYIPLIGLFIALTWVVCEWGEQRTALRRSVPVAVVVVLLSCAFVAVRQLSHWKSSNALYEHGLEVTEKNITLEMNLGSTLLDEGKTNAALERYEAVLKINPGDAMTHGNIARLYFAQGDWDRAAEHYQTALANDPGNARLHNTFGFALQNKDKVDEAVQQFQIALNLQPDLFQAAFNLGYSFLRQQKTNEAIASFEQGLSIEPDDAAAHHNLGTLLLGSGRLAEAEVQFREALRLRPDFPEAHHNLAAVFLAQRKTNSAPSLLNLAVQQLQQAIRLNTNDAGAHVQLATIASAKNDTAETVHQYREALRINPELPEALNNLAWILATAADPKLRNGQEAVQLAGKACQLVGYRMPVFVGTLAASYAEAGNFEKAIEMGETAYQLATSANQNDIAEKNLELLKLYRAGHPYWESNRATK